VAKGKIVIISSPSGGGKTSICRRLLTPARRRGGWTFSVSYTTRPKRPGERNGREYYFVTVSEFSRLAAQDFFAEHCRVHLYRYGTPREPVERVKKRGGVMLLDVDVKGARRLKSAYPEAITIFVLPPSLSALRQRLKRRGTETPEQLRVRFENARKEMKDFSRFDYVVVNDDLTKAAIKVLSIVEAHECRTDKMRKEQINRITR
jgi:guanylate kinase